MHRTPQIKRTGIFTSPLYAELFFLADQSLDTFTATFQISFATTTFLHFVDLLTHDNSLKFLFFITSSSLNIAYKNLKSKRISLIKRVLERKNRIFFLSPGQTLFSGRIFFSFPLKRVALRLYYLLRRFFYAADSGLNCFTVRKTAPENPEKAHHTFC